jgi:RNA polymerase sigma-70 factor (ECF subfamily)
MHLFLGYKSKEIADFLKMNENTVRSQESRALRKLEKKLKGI